MLYFSCMTVCSDCYVIVSKQWLLKRNHDLRTSVNDPGVAYVNTGWDVTEDGRITAMQPKSHSSPNSSLSMLGAA